MNPVFIILLTIITLISIFGLIYVVVYNNLQGNKIRINEAESIIDELLRKKYDLLNLKYQTLTVLLKVNLWIE